MSSRIVCISNPDSIQQAAAICTLEAQDACNVVAVVGAFHRQLLALQRSGVSGDDLINHPVAIGFISKLNSLCRMSLDREAAAFDALARLECREATEYVVIPL